MVIFCLNFGQAKILPCVDNQKDSAKIFLHMTWDPGGQVWHRLEGKPYFMGEGLSATSSILLPGLDIGLFLGLGPAQATGSRATTNARGDRNERLGLDRKASAWLGWLASLSPLWFLIVSLL